MVEGEHEVSTLRRLELTVSDNYLTGVESFGALGDRNHPAQGRRVR